MKTKSRLLLILVFGLNIAIAQTETENLGGLELVITDKYKGKVADANKYIEFPSFKDTSTQKLIVNYRINSKPIDVKFTPRALPPLKIKLVDIEKLPRGLVRVGYGLYNTSLAEAYFNSRRSSKYNYGFSAKHRATQNGVDGIVFDNNTISNNQMGAYLNRFYKTLAWRSNAYAEFNKVSYYGVDRLPVGETLSDDLDPNSNWYRQFGFNTALVSTNNKSMGWLQKVGLDYYNLSDDYLTKENNVSVNTLFDIPADKVHFTTELNLNFFKTEFDSLANFNQSFLTMQVHPKISTVYKEVIFDFGLNFFYNSGQNSTDLTSENNVHFFPELILKYAVVKDVITTYLGVEGNLVQNNMKSLVAENPYIKSGQGLTPSPTTDIFIGMNGIVSSSTSFNLRGGILQTSDMALFYRNPYYYFDSIHAGIDVVYADVTNLYFRGELAVNVLNNLQVNLSGELNSYDVKDNQSPWNLPGFTADLGVVYTLKDKIKTRTKLQYVGERSAFNQEVNLDVPSDLDPYLDLSLGIEYLYNSRLSAFVNVNNVLNVDYEYYLGYQTQGTNVLFGIGYQF